MEFFKHKVDLPVVATGAFHLDGKAELALEGASMPLKV
ncbi:MAG: hypothetical protein QOJ15_4572 [Bradyrhizobium sp.]|nr:hypothetical protein [Bradyrhizobium sp.]